MLAASIDESNVLLSIAKVILHPLAVDRLRVGQNSLMGDVQVIWH